MGRRQGRRQSRQARVSFERVREFEWNTAQIVVDNREDYGEVRMKALGIIGPVLHALVFTERGDNVRVISLRKATKREVNAYDPEA